MNKIEKLLAPYQKIINGVFFSILIVGILIFVFSSIKKDSKQIGFMEKYDQKADSLIRMQKHYEELLHESNLKIESLEDQRTIIEKEKPKIYNNYVTKYITNNSPADTSTFNQVYERSVHEFDSLWQSGFFVTK